MSKKIFEGLTLLDFTNNAAGPSCCAEFADHGANVIKIERPVVGDDTRHFNPILENGESLLYHWYNRGKKSITIAMDDPEGVEIIKKLTAEADIIVESFRPGIMKKFNVDYDSLVKIKPDIIYCSVSAFGQTGPYAMKPGYDLIAQAMSGVMDMTGEPDGQPIKSGFILGDFSGALNAFGAICAALYHREKTGEGQFIDVSLFEGLFQQNSFFEMASVCGQDPKRLGQHHATLSPYGVFSGKNGQNAVICAPNNKLWAIFCKAIGKEEYITHPDFATGPDRSSNLQKVVDIIEEWLVTYDDVDEAITMLDKLGIPCCTVKSTKQLMDDPHLIERGTIIEMETPPSYKKVRKLKMRGPWIKFSKTPMESSRSSDLGEYNQEIIGGLGYSEEEVTQLQNKWTEKATKKK